MKKIIGISGKAGNGKDQSAKFIKKILEERGERVLVIHFGDYLKFICEKYYNWDGQKNEKGRALLQSIGTDKIRNKTPDFWINTVGNFIDLFQDDWDIILVPDVRFLNECNFIKNRYDGIRLRVERRNYTTKLTKQQQEHISEIELDSYEFDYNISASSLEELQEECNNFLINNFLIKDVEKGII